MLFLQRKEADAMAVDGGQVYSAGMCGLVVAMVEEYNNECELNHGLMSLLFMIGKYYQNTKNNFKAFKASSHILLRVI